MNRERLRVLYLWASGSGTRAIAEDSLLGALAGRQSWRNRNRQLSYTEDWREAFEASPRLAVEACNINNLPHYAFCLARLARYELVVVSHAAAGDDVTVLSKSASAFQRRRGRLVVFLGNEYDLLEEKLAFVRQTQAEVVCTQLPIEAGHYLYGESGARIIEMPHALNPRCYYPMEGASRATDIGFIGDIYWPFIGDRERTDLIEWFETHGRSRGLVVDVRRQRVSREQWNRFLNGCKAVIGAESGTYYLNERGHVLDRARAYNLRENRSATFEEVYERFFANQPREVSGKSISSRHFEPIGTRTCQILLEGRYNDILRPNEHYIPVKRDLSNLDEALDRFRDERTRRRITEDAYEYVMGHHTYAHRVETLLHAIGY